MLHLTTDMCAAAYELLRVTPPFRRCKLPPADEVSFVVLWTDKCGADYFRLKDGTHRIRVNGKWHGSLPGLIQTMAHEMTHMMVDLACPSDQAHHGKRWTAAAVRVCRFHVFDHKRF